MAAYLFQFNCNECTWKRITDGTHIGDLYEYKTSEVPGGAPKIDPVTKKLIQPISIKQKRKFRCPTCGHAVIPKMIPDPQKELEARLETEERVRQRKELEDAILARGKKNEKNKPT